MKPRLWLAVLLVVGVLSAAVPAQGAPALRNFSYTGAGTNRVSLQTGQLRELWTGRTKPFGKIKTHVAGWLQFPGPRALAVHASMVIVDPSGDALIGACIGTEIFAHREKFEVSPGSSLF